MSEDIDAEFEGLEEIPAELFHMALMPQEAQNLRVALDARGYTQIREMSEDVGRVLEHWDNAEIPEKSKVFFFSDRDEGLVLITYADSLSVRMVDYLEALELLDTV